MYYLEDNIILTPLERLEPANYDLLSMHYKKNFWVVLSFLPSTALWKEDFALDSEDI